MVSHTYQNIYKIQSFQRWKYSYYKACTLYLSLSNNQLSKAYKELSRFSKYNLGDRKLKTKTKKQTSI